MRTRCRQIDVCDRDLTGPSLWERFDSGEMPEDIALEEAYDPERYIDLVSQLYEHYGIWKVGKNI